MIETAVISWLKILGEKLIEKFVDKWTDHILEKIKKKLIVIC